MLANVLRVLHFSDIHVHVSPWQMPWRGFLGKRLLGAINLRLRRSKDYFEAESKLVALAQLMDDVDIDLVIFTGDSTALGTEPEYRAASAAMNDFRKARLGMISIPGNHDLYLQDSIAQRNYERYFGDLYGSDLIEFRVDDHWPMVRLVEDTVAIVAVNSARPNPQIWLSNGRIPDAQLEALSRLLKHPALEERFVFIITHFAPRKPDGSPDTSLHGLENGEDFLAVCADLSHGAILHGHIHHRYHLQIDGIKPPIFCAGSATHRGREGLWVYEIEKTAQRAIPGYWHIDRYVLDREATVVI